MPTPLERKLLKALGGRRKANSIAVVNLLQETGSATAPDLFSNDYLSLSTNPAVRRAFIEAASSSKSVMGATGSRVLGGNSSVHIDFENRMKTTFGAEAALVFNTGYDSNLAFFNSVPQKGDVIIFDQLAHASIHDGLRTSRAAGGIYEFKHNSVRDLRERITQILVKHEDIAKGNATLFIAVESLYSMDGDLAPLPDIIRAAKELVPEGCYHIYVDEAHTTGICGPQGRGMLAALGLCNEVQSVLHTFSKGRGFLGGVILTSPIVREYMCNYARPFIYSTALPHAAIIALNASFDYIESKAGEEDMKRLRLNASYLLQRLTIAFASFHPSILSLTPPNHNVIKDEDDLTALPEDIASPIIPVHSAYPIELQDYLRTVGDLYYRVSAIAFPVVPRGQGRIRAIVHAGNTFEELELFVSQLVAWGKMKEAQVQAEGDAMIQAKL